MAKPLNCSCQFLGLNSSNGDLTITPNGNTVNLQSTIKGLQTLTSFSNFRLVGGTTLELTYTDELLVPTVRTVDLSGLVGGSGTPISVLDTNSIDLTLASNVLSAALRVDPASTMTVTSSSSGVKFDCCPETSLSAVDSNTIDFVTSGTAGHTLTGSIKYGGTTTVILSESITGLNATARISTTSGNILTTDPNGLLVASSTARGLVSATAPMAYNSTTGVFSMSQVGPSTNGWLSNTNFTIFNNKLSSVATTGSIIGDGVSPLSLIGDLVSPGNNRFYGTDSLGNKGWYVMPTPSLVALNDLLDVIITTPVSGQFLTYNGSNWVNTAISTSSITEGLNLYYTNARARAAISASLPLVYNSSTGALSINQSSISQDGYLSSANFSTFSSKVDNGTNLGTGFQIFTTKSGNNLQFKTLTGTAGQIVLTSTAGTVNIGIDPSFSGGGGGGSSLTPVTYTTNTTAGATDATKLVFIDSTAGNVVYTMNPATFTNVVLRIYALSTANLVTLTASSGNIEGATNYDMSDRECVHLWSDGVNFFIISRN